MLYIFIKSITSEKSRRSTMNKMGCVCKDVWGKAKPIDGNWKDAYRKPKGNLFGKAEVKKVYGKPRKMPGL